MNRKPRKILWIAVFCVCAVAVLIAFKAGLFASNKSLVFDGTNIQKQLLASAAQAQAASQDSDGDGVPDWEETLWGTDPHALSSNPAGISDKDWIAQQMAQQATASGNNTTSNDVAGDSAATSTGTLTEKYAEITTDTLLSNGTLTTSDLQDLSSTLKQDVAKLTNPPDRYTTVDLKTTNNNSVAQLATYGNNLMDLLSKYTSEVKMDPSAALEAAVTKKDPAPLAQLDPILAVYQDAINALVAMEVPSGMTTYHLVFVNDVWRSMQDLANAKTILTDPIGGNIAMKSYFDSWNKIMPDLAAIDTALRQAGAVPNTETKRYEAP